MERLRRLRDFLAPLFIVLLGIAVFAALVVTGPEAPSQAGKEQAWVVDTRTVEPGPRAPTLTLYGRLESPRDATIAAAVEADVESVPAAEGTTVADGEQLVFLDQRDLESTLAQRRAELADIQAQIREARAQHEADKAALNRQEELLELAKREVNRAEELAGRDVGSRAELDAARQALAQQRLSLIQQRLQVENFAARLDRLKAQRDRAEAQVARAERDLERATVAAPFAGRITGVEVAPGDRVRPGDALVSLYDPARLEVRATIPAPDVAAVRNALEAGNPPTAVVDVDGRRLEAVLDRLGGRSPQGVGGVEGLFRVKGEAPANLPLGRFAEVTVELPAEPGVAAVPFAALYGRDRIYVVRDGRMHALTVERVGQHADPGGPNLALVRAEGLRPGDEVVTTQLPRAMDGLKVRIRDEDAGAGR
jgi:multidrug resistance efflux pump